MKLDAVHRWARGRAGIAVLLALALVSGAIWLNDPGDGGATTGRFPVRALLLFGVQLAAVAVAWRRRDRWALAVVLVAAVGFRLAAVGWQPGLSSDLYRYLWDGRVQLAGLSPYAAAPGDPALADLRDDAVWPNINRPEAITVYPPGAQLAYLALAAAGGDSVDAVKRAALGAELIALALLIWLVLRRRLGAGHLLLYAWSPLVISEVCVSGHLDALVLPLAIAALALADRRAAWTGALIGAAALLKLYPLLLLCALPHPARLRAGAAAAAVIALGYLPYLAGAGGGVLGFLPDYVRTGEDFNPSVRGYLESGLAPLTAQARSLAMALVAAALAAVCLAVARRPGADRFAAARTLALAFVLLLPTAVHPWYALWLVPLAALAPSPAAIWIAGLLPLSYLKYVAPGELMPAWIPALEWLPALALLLVTWRTAARRTAARPAGLEAA